METQPTALDLSLLWPDFKHFWAVVFEGTRWDTSALSAAVVVTLLGLFAFFLLRVVIGAIRSARSIRFLKGLLRGITEDNLVSERANLAARAKTNGNAGGLWLEFDETLVSSPDKQRLWNTVDAAYFFNASTLAAGITESRLIAAVPGFLTALGVIGTFVGLQLGLSGLDLNQASTAETGRQIQRIIDSASVAFLTSVWGIGTSVFFNLIEKSIEQTLRKRISRLQVEIDRLFPRIRAEQQLIAIEDHGRESREVLQGLAEKIGDKMQEAVLDMSERLQEGIAASLSNVLVPAVEKLVDAASDLSNRQASSSEEVLKSLVGTFVERIGAQADQQRELMTNASAEMRSATTQMTDSLEDFIAKMESQLGSMHSGQTQFLEAVSGTISSHAQETSRLISQGEALTARVQEMDETLSKISTDLKDSSDSMKQGAALLDRTSRQIQGALDQFSNVLSESTKSTQAYVDETKDLITVINESLSFLGEFEGRTHKATESIKEISGTVDSGLNRLEKSQEHFLQGMQSNLESIQGQVAELLREYGDQVQGQTRDRLDVWNQQTREFSEQMVNAVTSMHEVLSEVQDMLAQLRRR